MALAISYDEVKQTQYRTEFPSDGGGVLSTRFFGDRSNPNLPLAQMNQMDPGLRTRTHFHVRDQFQVVIGGKGIMGRHVLVPYGVHFSRAYTAYGPLVADADRGLSFFVMRAYPDTGAQYLPENRELLKQISNRRPWQVTSLATFPVIPNEGIQKISEIHDENGLAAYTLSLQPGARMHAPDAALGDGQYLVFVKGSLMHDNKELNAPALVFVYPTESPFEIWAGLHGLEAIVLNFPRNVTANPRDP